MEMMRLGFKRFLISRNCVSDVVAASLCVRMYERGSHWTDFREIWYWALSRKPVETIQIWLKSGKNIGYLT
jgi:hypothetical protein